MSVKLQPGEELVVEASFDPAWKNYSITCDVLVMAFLACPLAFLVILAAGAESKTTGIVTAVLLLTPLIVWSVCKLWWVSRYFATLECYLTSRSIVYRRGIFWKREKTIPLTRIQDLGMMQGPLMRFFGIHRLKIETAGQSAPGGAGEALLIGVVDALGFRDRVLGLRDSQDLDTFGARDGLGLVAGSKERPAATATAGLADIHETLKRIESYLARLADKQPGGGSNPN